MTTYGIRKELIDMISDFYTSSGRSVHVNNQIGNPFSTTVGIRQCCLLSPVLINRPIRYLHFADNTDLIAYSFNELQQLTDSLAKIFLDME